MRTKHEVDVERETRATGEGAEEKFSAPYNPPPPPPTPSSESGAPCSPKKKPREKILVARKKKRKIKKLLLLFVQIYLLFSFLGCWLNTLKTEVIGLGSGGNGKVMFMLDQCLWQQLFSLLLFTSIFKL